MKDLIATIRLAPGNVGYYDPITGIHLTITSPERDIYRDMNTTNLRRSVKMGVLQLMKGTLSEPEKPVEIKEVPAAVKPEVKEVVVETVAATEIAAEVVNAVVEEVIEAPAQTEMVVVEQPVMEEVVAEESVAKEAVVEAVEEITEEVTTEETKNRKGRKKQE